MLSLEEIKISYYESKFAKENVEVSVLQIVSDIIRGRWKSEILTIRRYFGEGDAGAADRQKGKLPCVTFGGTFDGAHAISRLLRQSGVIVLDLDGVKDLERLKELCKADSHTAFCFCSPTDGYKIGAYVENAVGRHREAYRLVADYYARLTGLEIDESGKDESRLCFVSYDPDGHIAPLCRPFELEQPAVETVGQPLPDMPAMETDVTVGHTGVPPVITPREHVAEYVKSYLFLNPATPGNRNASLFRLGCDAAKRGYDREAVKSELLPRFSAPDFGEREIDSSLSNGYKAVREMRQGLPVAQGGMKTAGKMSKMSNVHYDTSENETDAEESYWEGEELRKKTPVIPGEVYENIPEMLTKCLVEGLLDRERDILLLSCLGAYSAMLPDTWATYDGKRFTPNLFLIAIAPAGSGKSIAKLGGELLQRVNGYIVGESEQMLSKYKNDRMEWQVQYSRKLKAKDETNLPDEPQEPPYRMLVIPSTTSYTRLQMQLRDNGSIGSIIFDTEAQTMANANRMDCGHFEDMLCKAFGHETISSSYKINGMRPIVIRRPALSVVLTGTNEQIYQLIEKPENGLLSRFLIYTYRSPAQWKEMGNTEKVNDDLFESLSEEAFTLYKYCKEHPLLFRFSRRQWGKLNAQFGELLAGADALGNDNLQAVVKRHALIVMRISMILTRMRMFESGDPSASCVCSDKDFDTALAMVLCCFRHSKLVLTSWPSSYTHPLKNPSRKEEFFESLPDRFTWEEALELGVSFELSVSTVARYLNQLKDVKISRIAHGVYQKSESKVL